MAARILVVLALAFFVNMAAGVLDKLCGDPVGINCVRQTMHFNGGCCLSFTSKTKVDEIVATVPKCDLTIVKRNCVFEGMSQTYIKDFSANYDDNVIVLLLSYPKLRVRCDMDIYFHRIGDSTKMVPTRCDATYTDYSTTTLFGIKCDTYIFDVEKRQTRPGMKTYTVTYGSPELTAAAQNDPRVAAGVNCINANLKTIMSEIQYEKCKAFSTYYIRNRLVEVEDETPWKYPLWFN